MNIKMILLFSVLLSFSLSANIRQDLMKKEVLNQMSFREQTQGIVVVTLSPYCPCSQSHMKHLSELSQKMETLQFVGLHVESGVDLVEAKKFYSESGLTFPVVADHDLQLARSLKAVTTPHAFVLLEQSLIAVYEGAVTNSAHFAQDNDLLLERSLEQLTVGLKPSRRKTRPHGCAINYAI